MERDTCLKIANKQCGYRIMTTRKAALEGVVVNTRNDNNPASLYGKCLLHDANGKTNSHASKLLVEAIFEADSKKMQEVILGGSRKLDTPSAAFSYLLEGP